MSATGRARVFLQWKGTDACYDFYCPCNPEEPQHFDGLLGDMFTCGSEQEDDSAEPPAAGWCGRTFQLPWWLTATETVAAP
jgi:hypothetical protein